MNELWIYNGTIVTAERTFPGSLYIRDGVIQDVMEGSAATFPPAGSVSGIPSLDAKGCHILPGLIDAHVHLRDPGSPAKEDFASGTAAAACGGVTTLLDMPNTDPPVATVSVLRDKRRLVQERAFVDYGLYGVITTDNLAELPSLAVEGIIGYKLFLGPTTGDIRAPGWGRLMEVFTAAAQADLPIVVHAEDRDVIEHWSGRIPEGTLDYADFLQTRPRFGEAAATQTVALLAQLTGARVHIAHMAIAEAVDLVQEARQRGARVTAETCPPYLLLDEGDCRRLGPLAKILPPVRSRTDQERLWQGLADDTIDCIATDHAPHTAVEKAEPNWLTAPGGTVGVETLLPLLLNEVHRGRCSLNQLVDWTSRRPARIFGLAPAKGDIRPGSDADLVLVDMALTRTLEPQQLRSRSHNTPFAGWELRGGPVATLLRGRVIAREGTVVGEPSGRNVIS